MKPVHEEAFAVWFTGLPAAGKSTIAGALASLLRDGGIPVVVLDSDEFRAVLVQDHYDAASRHQFYRTLAGIAALVVRQNVPVIVAATANLQAYRDEGRRQIQHLLEVFVDTTLATCMARDPKRIYRNGTEGTIDQVPGLQAPYEVPLSPDLVVHGHDETPDAGARRVLARLIEAGVLTP